MGSTNKQLDIDLVQTKSIYYVMKLTIHKAKTHLSRILHQVEGGEEVTLCRGVVPVAKIVPLTPPKNARPAVGQPTAKAFPIPHDAFAPLTERELMDWGIR